MTAFDMTDVSIPTGRGMIDLRKMEQFVAVAEEGNFHRAAHRLGMSQPPLTVAIKRLEEDLGVVLIERGGNRIIGLTAAGQAFLHEARATLRQADYSINIARETAAGRKGLLRIGYVGSALYGRLPDTIQAFRQARPRLRVELREATTAAQIAGLLGGTLDVGIVIPPIPDTEGVVLHSFDRDRFCMALPRDHPLSDRHDLLLSDLAAEAFVMWPMVEGRGFHLQAIRLCANAGFVPHVVQEAHGMHAVLSLVAVGAGVAIVPKSMTSFMPERIVYREVPMQEAAFDLCLAVHAPTPASSAFVEMAMAASGASTTAMPPAP